MKLIDVLLKVPSGSEKISRRILIALIVFPFLTTGLITDNPRKAVIWKRWEYTLTANNKPEGKPAEIIVKFSGPNGKSFSNNAFTDDGIVFKFRASFPAAGKWTWITECSDPSDKGLHNKRGKVSVARYSGENPLYRHGDLKVSENKRYLVHADGKPFLWIGDTGWNVLLRSTMGEWRDYVDKRLDQGFTVIQVVPKGAAKVPEKTAKGTLSFKSDGTPDPAYWQDVENKVAYANDKGIIVFFTGMGGSWKNLFAENNFNQSFTTYIAGRFSGHFVIFSPSMDQRYDEGNDKTAEELNPLTTHLVTQHPGTHYETSLRYRNSPWLDFCGLQSGHHSGNLTKAYNAARAWTLDMYNGTPVKPVINIEAMYDAYGHDNAKNWREKDVRKLGWMSWLSGSMGYTYGAGDIPPKVPGGSGGIWRYNTDSATYDFWRKAMLWPSAGQMTIMRQFFETLKWWELMPSHDLIINQASDETLKMTVSKSSGSDLLLAYLPDNQSVELDLSGLPGLKEGKWFNPVTGVYIEVNQPFTQGSRNTFSRPQGWEDAVLILKK